MMKIVLIGSGNVASHLGKAMSSLNGYPIAQIFSKTKVHARKLAEKLSCSYTVHAAEIVPNADLYLIAVADDQVKNVAIQLSKYIHPASLVVHTSGSLPSTILAPYFKKYGVIYPLQTFSKSKKMVYHTIPFLITSSSAKNTITLKKLASQISNSVYICTDESRSLIHLTAVLVNNFTNALFDIAAQLLAKNKLPFKLVLPLIDETVLKLHSLSPMEAQTGPAKRNDKSVLAMHRKILKSYPREWSKIYNDITSEIIKRHHS